METNCGWIAALALLHQYQGPVRSAHGVSYVEATREDIAMADRLMKELMGKMGKKHGDA